MNTKSTPRYVFEMPIKVRDYEVDSQGIVNNANYQHYLEHTRHEFCEQAGFSFREMHSKGIDPVVRRIEIDYLHPLGLGQTMISRLALERKGPLFVFVQDIYTPEGLPVIRARVMVATTVNGHLTRGEELFEKFRDYVTDPA